MAQPLKASPCEVEKIGGDVERSQKNAMRSLEEFTVDNHLNFLEIFLGKVEDQTFKPLEDQTFKPPFFLKV